MSQAGAGPQLDAGHLKIANELFDAILLFPFSQRQQKVVLAVVRKTYGFNKKEDDMSASQLGKLCGMDRHHVTEVIGQLVDMRVLNRRQGAYGLVLGINKFYTQWLRPAGKKRRVDVDANDSASPNLGLAEKPEDTVDLGTEVVPTRDSPNLGLVPTWDKSSPNLGQVDSPNLGHTKDNLSKDNQKTKRAPKKEICFDDWKQEMIDAGAKLLADDHPSFAYAKKIGLPEHFIRLAWFAFDQDHSGNHEKKQASWPQTFSTYVRKGWLDIWRSKGGVWYLSNRGVQVECEYKAEHVPEASNDPEAWRKNPKFAGGK